MSTSGNHNGRGRYGAPRLCTYCDRPVPVTGSLVDLDAGGWFCSEGCHDEHLSERYERQLDRDRIAAAEAEDYDERPTWDAEGRL